MATSDCSVCEGGQAVAADQIAEQIKCVMSEAITALLAMDADRLEELSRCTADLNRDLGYAQSLAVGRALAAHPENIHLFGRILLETRANLSVFTRIRAAALSALPPSPTLPAISRPAISLPATSQEDHDYGHN